MALDWIDRTQEKIRDKFLTNPLAWILLAMFLVAEWNNYEKGSDLRRLCDLVWSDNQTTRYATKVGQMVDHICSLLR